MEDSDFPARPLQENGEGHPSGSEESRPAAPGARPAPRWRNAFQAVLHVFGKVVVVMLGSAGLLMVSAPVGWLVLEALDHLRPETEPMDYLQVWTFEEAAAGVGDRDAVATAVDNAGLSARWIFEDDGTGRVALDCDDWCYRDPFEDCGAFARLFQDHGFRLEGEKDLKPDHRGELRSRWAGGLLVKTWLAIASSLPFLMFGGRVDWLSSPRLSALPATVTGIALGTVLILAETSLIWAVPDLGQQTAGGETLQDLAPAGLLGFGLALLAGVVVAPIAEEYFFRGWVLPYLDREAGPATAYIASAGIWALLHFSLTALPILFLVGLVLAWAYRRWGSLLIPIAAHATGNAFLIVETKLTTPPF